MNPIIVRMADLDFASDDNILRTNSLGSCLGIIIYDKKNKIGSLAHTMLPNLYENYDFETHKGKFVDSAIPYMIDTLEHRGAYRHNLNAMIFGGSQMFFTSSQSLIQNIGKKNIDTSIKIFKEYNIPIIANETGGQISRTIELYCDKGLVILYELNKVKKSFLF